MICVMILSLNVTEYEQGCGLPQPIAFIYPFDMCPGATWDKNLCQLSLQEFSNLKFNSRHEKHGVRVIQKHPFLAMREKTGVLPLTVSYGDSIWWVLVSPSHRGTEKDRWSAFPEVVRFVSGGAGAGMESLRNDLNNSHKAATKCQTLSGGPSSEGNMCSLCPHRASSPGGTREHRGARGQVIVIHPEGSDGGKRTNPEPGAPGGRSPQALV